MNYRESARRRLLQRCIEWIAENWAPSWDYPKAWDEAIFNIVGGPAPKEDQILRHVSPDQFTKNQLLIFTDTYFELTKLAGDYDLSDDIARWHQRVARQAFAILSEVMDRAPESKDPIPVDEWVGRRAAAARWVDRDERQDSLREMFEVVVHWLINAQAGCGRPRTRSYISPVCSMTRTIRNTNNFWGPAMTRPPESRFIALTNG